MIKGVNKRILEIALPESEYFERAVLFIRADAPPACEMQLISQAHKLLPAEKGRRFSIRLMFSAFTLMSKAAVIVIAAWMLTHFTC